MSRAKVLMLLTNAFDPDPRVHQEATALVESGYDVTIFCWDRDYKTPAHEIIDGIKVERIYVRSTHGRGITQILFLFLFWLKAYLRASSKDFDVVHCHDFDTLPLGYILSRQKDAKLVYDAHESYVDMLGNIPKWLKVLIYQAENILLRRTDLLITVGEILRKNLAKRGAKNTCVVGNWKDPKRFKFPSKVLEREKKSLNIADGQLIICFIANLGKERQLPQLIEAVKNMPETFLIIGGNGPCRGLVEDAARMYPNIHYLGYVNPDKIPFYTAMSDVVFYGFDPSNPNAKYSAPNKLFEALAAGKPTLTGDFGEIGRIVRETQSGHILSTYSTDEIKKALSLLSNSAVIGRFAEKARNAGLNKYCWDKARLILLRKYEYLNQKRLSC
jgi:glycosyltransferase involved in cell wall biosynthesis